MIKNIIFDFGDIFINLDKQAVYRDLAKYGHPALTPEMDTLAKTYEVGKISSPDFIKELQRLVPKATAEEITQAWNSILLDFPESRLHFIEQLAADKQYRLFLLSNTNDLHIDYVKKTMGLDRFQRFQACFEQFYLSHEIHLRKPNLDIYQFVLNENDLKPQESFFVDDTKENTDAAEGLGITTWHLKVGEEDITDLKAKL
ncbi:HAD family hydrolase [Maribacter sp. 2307ULW6-5]|uniref:HAD family hydrolase n=1 Tax=Maribacter sp. 2307ULW6-5 TaxID=3386275 RepID=UPI0039BC5115